MIFLRGNFLFLYHGHILVPPNCLTFSSIDKTHYVKRIFTLVVIFASHLIENDHEMRNTLKHQ